MKSTSVFVLLIMLFAESALAQNPIIRDQFTADPSARVFKGKVYVYPSHDILANENRGRVGWFCMEDYHVFSSSNLTEWTDHGVIVSQNDVNWVDPATYSMWAPDCIERNGKYYFYFPANMKSEKQRKSFGIGLAVAEQPEGPYKIQPEPISNVVGIDPNAFIDKDGQAYLYWSLGQLFVAKLKDNMLELDSEPQVVLDLPQEGLKEGPYMFERNGIYYMTYPHVENKTERLEYAIGDNPLGPFKITGVIMDESPIGCWTNHQSIQKYNGQWYLFYHHNDYSPTFDKARSICIDSLFFNDDGTIQKVIPTLRGVGISNAFQQLEIDRYSRICEKGAAIDFMDTTNTFQGWKTVFEKKNAWIQYNVVDFGEKMAKSVQLRVTSPKGGRLKIHIDHVDGPLLTEVEIPENTEWKMIESDALISTTGIHNLVLISGEDHPLELDWIRFSD